MLLKTPTMLSPCYYVLQIFLLCRFAKLRCCIVMDLIKNISISFFFESYIFQVATS